jgi:sensor c-di-GMP phosphodiesterase-like protein
VYISFLHRWRKEKCGNRFSIAKRKDIKKKNTETDTTRRQHPTRTHIHRTPRKREMQSGSDATVVISCIHNYNRQDRRVSKKEATTTSLARRWGVGALVTWYLGREQHRQKLNELHQRSALAKHKFTEVHNERTHTHTHVRSRAKTVENKM